jgi:hypothetical protein
MNSETPLRMAGRAAAWGLILGILELVIISISANFDLVSTGDDPDSWVRDASALLAILTASSFASGFILPRLGHVRQLIAMGGALLVILQLVLARMDDGPWLIVHWTLGLTSLGALVHVMFSRVRTGVRWTIVGAVAVLGLVLTVDLTSDVPASEYLSFLALLAAGVVLAMTAIPPSSFRSPCRECGEQPREPNN